jgi:hypothetical protein
MPPPIWGGLLRGLAGIGSLARIIGQGMNSQSARGIASDRLEGVQGKFLGARMERASTNSIENQTPPFVGPGISTSGARTPLGTLPIASQTYC